MSIKKWLTTFEGESEVPHAGMIVLGLILSIVAVAVEAYTISRFRATRAAETWPAATGVIMRSSWAEQPGSRETIAEIEYHYLVGERVYKAQQVKFGQGARIPKTEGKDTLEHYPLESEVQVFYNPDNPAEACLERGIVPADYATIIAPVIFAIFMALGTFEMYRIRRRHLSA